MARNLKALGLALVAVFAMSAVVTSSASADYIFTSEESGATSVTGEQIEGKHKFTVGGQSVECTNATFSGTQTGGEANDLTITPTYTNCTYGAKIADVTMNGCTYTFTGETQVSGHGIVHVLCPVGQKIEVHITNFSGSETCTMTISAQTPGQGYSAVNTGNDVKVTATVTGVAVATDGNALACKALAVANATYNGVATLRGYKDGSAHTEANQVKISVD